MPFIQKPFYMIRHGETHGNKAQLLTGHMDTQLTDLGRRQASEARLVVETLERKPDVIYHSHLSRARDTAAIINENLSISMREDTGYAEINMGDWEGQPAGRGLKDSKWDKLFTEGAHPPNGENLETFASRIKTSKNKALSAGHDLPMIVCHGGVFRAFARLHGLDNRPTQNCQLHYFEPAQEPASTAFPWRVYTFELAGGRLQQTEIEFIV